MVESEVVEIDGVFVGAAILQADRAGLAFFATHERLRPLRGAVLSSLAEIRHQAARHFRGQEKKGQGSALDPLGPRAPTPDP